MVDITLSLRLPDDLDKSLNALSASTDRSKDHLVREAIECFVETELEVIDAIKRASADIQAGRTVPHAEAVRLIRATIADAASLSEAP